MSIVQKSIKNVDHRIDCDVSIRTSSTYTNMEDEK